MPVHNTLSSRSCEPASDLPRIARFVTSTAARCPLYEWGHVGNLWWSMYYSTRVDPRRNARLWEDAEGSLLGLAWLDHGEFVLHVHPDVRGSGWVEAPMLLWAEQEARAASAGNEAKLFTSIDVEDETYSTLLEQWGFHLGEHEGVLLERGLDEPLPDLPPPEGATVRHVLHPSEDVARVEIHRDVWAPSSFTLESYERLCLAPDYIPELDLVAVLPDGSFGAYCICWWEPESKRGLFEPVGTRPAWRRRGLGRAVLLEGLRRLRAYGARTAIVFTAASNVGAVKLYEAVGMRVVQRWRQYVKHV